MTWSAPGEDTVEVSLIGRGYGESVVVHIGWGDWLIVDSCSPARTNRSSYALAYLREIDVDPGRVRWIVASHWHDDHVRGFSDAVKTCSAANVYISEALLNQEFFALAFAAEDIPGAITAGPTELRDTIQHLQATDRKPQLARADQRLFADENSGTSREIWALSPSNAANLLSKQSFARDIALLEAGRAIPAPEANEASVALHITVGDLVMLLGADLERLDAHPDRGWDAVLDSPGRPSHLASLFKIAHHGADNGDHPRVWEELLEEQALGLLTPYTPGKRPRPDDADVERLRARTDRLFLAGPRTGPKRTPGDNAVERLRRSATRKSVISESPLGHVRARGRVCDGVWSVDVRGNTTRL